MCIIAVANQKGGTGKTTTCVNLGIGLARAGKKVLLVDADAQGSMAVSLGVREPDNLDHTIVNIMEKVINDEDIADNEGIMHHEEGVDFIPANIELAGLETALVGVMSREFVLKSYHINDTIKGGIRHDAKQAEVLQNRAVVPAYSDAGVYFCHVCTVICRVGQHKRSGNHLAAPHFPQRLR